MATFLQVTAHGGYTTGGWSGEVAQCGWSFPIAPDDPETTPVTNADIEEPDYDDSASSGTWAHGTFLRGFGGDVLTEAVQTAIAGHVYTWLTAIKPYQMSTFKWQRITQQLIHWDDTPPTGWGQIYETTTHAITPVMSGTVSGSVFGPPQTAACVSHYTGSTGSRNRGRVYVPFHAGTGSDQLMPASANTALGNAEVAFFENMAEQALGDSTHLIPAVVSKTHISYSTVTEVRVGDELDTQRRRRNNRTEIYAEFPFPSA